MTIAYGPVPEQLADVHLPADPAAPVLVYFHGGGLEGGTRADHPGLFAHLVAAGIGVVSADYRLYPSARYPDFLTDAGLCVAWVHATMPDRPLLVGGTSAGAYLAMMLRFDDRWLTAEVRDAVVGWFFDAGQPTTHFRVLAERGQDGRRVVVDEAAPIFHLGPQTRPAPTVIMLAERDIPGRREQTELMLATMRDFGVDADVHVAVVAGATHSSYVGTEQGQAQIAALVSGLTAR